MTTSKTKRSDRDAFPMATGSDDGDVEWRRVGLFVLFAFGISWTIGVIVSMTGGIGSESPMVFAGVRLWLVLVVTGYMFSPAIANVLTRLVTGEGWDGLALRPRRRHWRWWAVAWVVPPVLLYLGATVFFVLFPEFFDPTLSAVGETLGVTQGTELPIEPRELALIAAVAAPTINTAVNCVATFGEEFGWRAYLLPKLLPLGGRRAILLSGVIWGVWHWPLIVLGYNYPETPLLGSLAMVYFTVVAGVFLGWVTLRGNSVWPAVIGHAAINANAGIMLLFTQNDPSRLLGPAVTGVIGSLPLAVFAVWLLVCSNVFSPPSSSNF